MLHGPQREQVELTFSIPSICAQRVEQKLVDIGLVPVAEIARQRLEVVPGVGIAADGPVRSILLFSRTPWRHIRTLAVDLSSRTSVELARVILRERFGIQPEIRSEPPDLSRMLDTADAALIIGDPALRIEPDEQPFEWLDLAAEWTSLTQLPIVFAGWAGQPGIPVSALSDITIGSYRHGAEHLDEIIACEAAARGLSPALAAQYLREHIKFEIGARELRGLETFCDLAGLNVCPAI